MQASDLSDPLESTMPKPHGLAGRYPPTLLLVQPTQQEIELPMIFSVPMFTRMTVHTTTIVYRQ